jgi:hypothetical protein
MGVEKCYCFNAIAFAVCVLKSGGKTRFVNKALKPAS